MLLLLVYVSIIMATCGGVFAAMLVADTVYWTRLIFIASYMMLMVFSLYLVNKYVDDSIDHAHNSFIDYSHCGDGDITRDEQPIRAPSRVCV